MTQRTLVLIFFLAGVVGCSPKRLDSKFEGLYFEVNGRAQFSINGNRGDCDLNPSGSELMTGDCTIEGNKLIFTVKPNTGWPQNNLPEFKDGIETMRIEGNAFITSVDRRFVKAVQDNKGNAVLPPDVGPSPSSYAPSSGDGLSNSTAETTLDQWGMCADHIKVQGIQELPQQNAARAILLFSDCQLSGGHSMFGGKARPYSGPGEAVFIRFSDGTWILSKVQTSQGMDSVHWDDLNVKAR